MKSAYPVVIAVLAISACHGSNPSSPANYGRGPNYSSTPCTDNCGGEAACTINCTNSAGDPRGLRWTEPGPYTPR